MNELSGHTELFDPREELAELASATLALVQWYADAGASGLPVEGSVEATLLSLTGAAPAARPAAGQRPPVIPPAFAGGVPSWGTGKPEPASLPTPSRQLPVAQPQFSRPQVPASAFASAALPGTRAASSVEAPPSNLRAPAASPEEAPASLSVSSPTAETGLPRATSAAVSTGSSGANLDERQTRLALLAEEARACSRCALHAERKQAVFARGNPFSELCFVGEGPGADEDALGEPFVGAAGQLLDKMIVAMGYRRDEVYICNIVKCRPPKNRKPEPAEMAACSPFLTEQLGLIQPRVIVALGATAVQGLIGASEGITRLRGKWKLYKGTTPIMPTFHPAYLLRSPGAKRDVWADLQEVMRHLGKGPPAKG